MQAHYSPSALTHSISRRTRTDPHLLSPKAHNFSMNSPMGYSRPINRIFPVQFLRHSHAMRNWEIIEELMANIERADYTQVSRPSPLECPALPTQVAQQDLCPSCSKSLSAIKSAQTNRKDADCQVSSGLQRSWSTRILKREKGAQPSDIARVCERTLLTSQVSFPLRGHS
jgi:hypothetical protein